MKYRPEICRCMLPLKNPRHPGHSAPLFTGLILLGKSRQPRCRVFCSPVSRPTCRRIDKLFTEQPSFRDGVNIKWPGFTLATWRWKFGKVLDGLGASVDRVTDRRRRDHHRSEITFSISGTRDVSWPERRGTPNQPHCAQREKEKEEEGMV